MEKKGVLIPMVLAMLAAVFYLMVLTSKEKALTSDYEKAKVLIARADIPERTVLHEDMVDTLDVAQHVAWKGGPPEYVDEHFERLVDSAQNNAEGLLAKKK